ncbi:MAG: holo-ACP synthase CitX [Firmicutes bacterium]|nr:holo-ACP synthase CitX [Bacillota bacterium]
MSHALFEGISITLEEVLTNKEARAALQRELLAQYKSPIISFTINMPGSVKLNNASRLLYKNGIERLKDALERAYILVNDIRYVENFTGLEALFSVRTDAQTLKKIACTIEDQDAVGRLFDMDVLDVDGVPISRSALDLPKRKCLICQQDAVICARSRQHAPAELLHEIEKVVVEAQK